MVQTPCTPAALVASIALPKWTNAIDVGAIRGRHAV
jgi:hypothetical protein